MSRFSNKKIKQQKIGQKIVHKLVDGLNFRYIFIGSFFVYAYWRSTSKFENWKNNWFGVKSVIPDKKQCVDVTMQAYNKIPSKDQCIDTSSKIYNSVKQSEQFQNYSKLAGDIYRGKSGVYSLETNENFRINFIKVSKTHAVNAADLTKDGSNRTIEYLRNHFKSK